MVDLDQPKFRELVEFARAQQGFIHRFDFDCPAHRWNTLRLRVFLRPLGEIEVDVAQDILGSCSRDKFTFVFDRDFGDTAVQRFVGIRGGCDDVGIENSSLK